MYGCTSTSFELSFYVNIFHAKISISLMYEYRPYPYCFISLLLSFLYLKESFTSSKQCTLGSYVCMFTEICRWPKIYKRLYIQVSRTSYVMCICMYIHTCLLVLQRISAHWNLYTPILSQKFKKKKKKTRLKPKTSLKICANIQWLFDWLTVCREVLILKSCRYCAGNLRAYM